MKRTARLLLVCLIFVLLAASHSVLAAKTTKAVAGQAGVTSQKASQLNLNTASVDQLAQLPGIGPKTAAAIVNKRTELGGKFNSLDQLLEVKGIGQKKLDKIKPSLSL